MNISASKPRKGRGRRKEEERIQPSSPSSHPSTSVQPKTHSRPTRFQNEGKNNALRETTSPASTGGPGAVKYPPYLAFSTEKKQDNSNWKNLSRPLRPMNERKGQLTTGMRDRHFPPLSAPLAIRANPELQQVRPAPPPQPEQSNDMKCRGSDGSCLATRQATLLELAQQPSPCIIEKTPDYMFHLKSLVANPNKLREVGYVLNPLSSEDIELKKRCSGCGKTMKSLRTREQRQRKEGCEKSKGRPRKPNHNTDEKKGASQANKTDGKCDNDGTNTTPKKKVLHCKFHPGTLIWNRQEKTWSCCRQPAAAEPCSGAEQHHPRFYLPGKMESMWQFHHTPRTPNMPSPDIRTAVAIDCEMGQASSGDSELIRVTLIDYFSSAVLIDSLVYPSVKMEDYRTRFSGVSKRDMETAIRSGTCIMGRDNARLAMWKYVGPETVVVGHSAHNDLESLRWIHATIVDTYIIEALLQKEKEKDDESKQAADNSVKDGKVAAEQDKTSPPAVKPEACEDEQNEDGKGKPGERNEESKKSSNSGGIPDEGGLGKPKQGVRKRNNKGSGKLSLKTLARERLGREIQNAGKKGHDSLEDALAARDLAHWHVVNSGMVGLDDGKKT
ncbi:hypothetical protein AJ78_06097 [Emergomyces pasteurianus Ep9510]|uniref:Exonuclease domain-containing protein n=1 Tax=Emergomyces pasteurianus Ep9510 TaxID=1447872 RepID=A0A1J9QC01_9EURO|nr:hypothetical protein AJ78_06097 [Emergomyces pasteurianus Ep9510]